jgi:tRNA 2-thiouridine synthesizing protein A
MMKADFKIDAKGFACPMPVVRAKRAMDELQSGQVLEIHATDKGSLTDLTAWAESLGHKVLEKKEENGVFQFWIKKA